MLAVGGLLLLLLAWMINIYTQHGEEVVIPEIRGKHLTEARDLLATQGIAYEVVDSLYDPEATPGAVKESVPMVGARVKPGRTIYLTIYAVSPRPILLPYVENMSARQARAVLSAMGFDDIKIRVVPGEYRDLCIGLTDASGRMLSAGMPVLRGASLVMLVSGQVQDSIRVSDLIESSEGEWVDGDTSTSSVGVDSTERKSTGTTSPEDWW